MLFSWSESAAPRPSCRNARLVSAQAAERRALVAPDVAESEL